MLYKTKVFIFLLVAVVAMPAYSFEGGADPNDNCPKKKKSKQDSVGIYESENKVMEEADLKEFQFQQPDTKQSTNETNYNSPNELVEVKEVDEKDPNSAMSFNIIYYIIDKFKFADPLE